MEHAHSNLLINTNIYLLFINNTNSTKKNIKNKKERKKGGGAGWGQNI